MVFLNTPNYHSDSNARPTIRKKTSLELDIITTFSDDQLKINKNTFFFHECGGKFEMAGIHPFFARNRAAGLMAGLHP